MRSRLCTAIGRLSLLSLLLVFTACAKKVVNSTPSSAQTSRTSDAGSALPPAAEATAGTPAIDARLGAIYFDYDSARLMPRAVDDLNRSGERLLAEPKLAVRLEGHCDERGTQEYNLALGERRARAARDYLVSFGIPANRLDPISFGEERPADPGHEESAWQLNRRVEFSPR